MTFRRNWTFAMVSLVMLPLLASAGRYEQYSKKAAQDADMKVVAATFFGGEGAEEFVAVDVLPDGTIVAMGNAGGPKFTAPLKPRVLGEGNHRGLEAIATDRKGRKSLARENPDAAGMVVFYKPQLRGIEKIARFDWGVANIETGAVTRDGKGILLAGRCTGAFDSVTRHADSVKIEPQPAGPQGGRKKRRRGPNFGPYKYDGVEVSGDVYVMRISAKTASPEWVYILRGFRRPPEQLWVDLEGNVFFEAYGVRAISKDGKSMKHITGGGWGGKVGLRAVNPKTGEYYYGGDRNTNTGREPWRQPFLYKYDVKGNKIWTAWEWNSRRVGSDQYRLVSDSAARCGDVAPDGDVLIGGWSDGGNSVFTRQPYDLDKTAPKSSTGMSSWGMKNANSLAYILRLDPKTRQQKSWTLWLSFIPDDFSSPKHRNSPNFASLERVKVLADGSVGLLGGAATGLIQTPTSFWTYPRDGEKHGGRFAAILSPDLSKIRFSSYWPGCKDLALGVTSKGMVVVSRSDNDGGQMGNSPTKNAIQPKFGGIFDAHIVLISE